MKIYLSIYLHNAEIIGFQNWAVCVFTTLGNYFWVINIRICYNVPKCQSVLNAVFNSTMPFSFATLISWGCEIIVNSEVDSRAVNKRVLLK